MYHNFFFAFCVVSHNILIKQLLQIVSVCCVVMDLLQVWLDQKSREKRHVTFVYSYLKHQDIWMCTLLVHDDDLACRSTRTTALFYGTSKNTKQTAKKMAIYGFLDHLNNFNDAQQCVDSTPLSPQMTPYLLDDE